MVISLMYTGYQKKPQYLPILGKVEFFEKNLTKYKKSLELVLSQELSIDSHNAASLCKHENKAFTVHTT